VRLALCNGDVAVCHSVTCLWRLTESDVMLVTNRKLLAANEKIMEILQTNILNPVFSSRKIHRIFFITINLLMFREIIPVYF
jgi:hypothetical protein